MVRTKKPSAKKQTHNKCKNAKGLRPYKWSELKNLRQKSKCTISAKTQGLRPYKWSEPKNLRQKSNSKESKDGCQKGGRRFFFPNPRHPSFDKPMRQRRTCKGGYVFPRTKIARIASYGSNLLPERITTTKSTNPKPTEWGHQRTKCEKGGRRFS